MVHFCFQLSPLCEADKEKVIIAAAFHDIGIWIENTVDYIEPSIPPAMQYLQQHQMTHLNDEVTLLIREHHKIRTIKDPKQNLIEQFRQADLVDFSIGMVRFGVDKAYIKAVKAAFPNAGFHKALMGRALRWLPRHPLNPLPMMKW